MFTLFIALENMTAEQYCLSLDSRNLGCYSITEFPLELTVKLEQSEQLTLLDTKQTTLLTTTLFIKSQRQKQRRRLRSPWSIF
ncbi:MAG: DUF3019 domain-containing protein [Paraglaciecola sp.]|nr:DUF3019 domain-containing protein [Paraglaciecola sp.]MDP5131925.1 DUF3019 domain-containing protein [Paraglaciecola sp.]